MKGDKMFRSSWGNGEMGTPEQWKIKPKSIYLLYIIIFLLYFKTFHDSNLAPKTRLNHGYYYTFSYFFIIFNKNQHLIPKRDAFTM
ncbi:MAG: hypothetical protein WA816_09935 [Bacteroidales bacterium]